MAFIRLIGTVYFKNHLSAFVALRSVHTPVQLYNAINCESHEERHKQWYTEIRGIISDRICDEADRVPSYTSMLRHWQR